MEIEDSVVVITGGAQGLGFAMAQRFAEKGANIALIDANAKQLVTAVNELENIAGKVCGYAADITDEKAVKETFMSILSELGKVNVLVNNAGILRDGLTVKAKDGEILDEMSLEQFNAVINVNLSGTFVCGKEAAKAMITSKQQGVIINISSVAKDGNMGQSNYSAAKAGVASLAIVWAKELARYNIRAAAIAPGACYSAMTASMKPEALQRLEQMAPVRSLGQDYEIAQTAQFIVENDFYNGKVLAVDGGLVL
ncbi:SDR family NAD(P)-dependent oxidoreductase [Vibrio hangzhouensis]|uniref:3-oxoacyl-[acyl-carrier protein] reductase n=1 Tax=Vibrio hangzhouensis TaxID=462991 RepID=A0A1H5ZSH3_9VIBR|nr:SDR family NAD(P)-dependent oxidoreductase [Vibrio hangzhouensis]SEG38627.1 3-oxoacyl-[acyl-carrier protein] reductase [Vibrio hangzhouensis]